MEEENKKVKVLVLFYSFTGGVAELARSVGAGAKEIENTEIMIRRVPELIPDTFFDSHQNLKEVKERMEQEFPLATIQDLVDADAVAFGTPVHFGSFAAQLKQFLDQLSSVFLQHKMVNKPASVFCASGSLHGGEELTLISLMIPLLNLGMIPVGIPYPIQGGSAAYDSGSPYGAIAIRRHPQVKLTEGEVKAATILGRRLALTAHMFQCGCSHCISCQALITPEPEGPLKEVPIEETHP